ncbi:glycerol-3-phosphate dehydrogenase [Gracilaria domingensis]|nr:glycerol-3-phosphate dehydrogenase [Gracilaria domingensis]
MAPIVIRTEPGVRSHATPPPAHSRQDSTDEVLPMKRVCIVGAGNWGSAAAIIIANNVKNFDYYHDTINMWVFEEIIEDRKLSEIINETHYNVKYLPDHRLPDNIVAVPDLLEAAADCNVFVFVLPHQFLPRACKTLKGHIAPDSIGISLIKGIDFDEGGVVLMTDIITKELSIDVSVLSGANIANEIAAGKFCESTIGYSNSDNAIVFFELFNNRNFRISLIKDVQSVQVFGALKNVIALGAGFCDALDMGNNTKAALIRIGLLEMHRFASKYFAPIHDATMVESCGVADLITTCMGGRNRRVSEAFARARGKRSWEELEDEMLKGQKLQGTSTVLEVMKILQRDDCVNQFPFIKLIYQIAYDAAEIETIVDFPDEHAADALDDLDE